MSASLPCAHVPASCPPARVPAGSLHDASGAACRACMSVFWCGDNCSDMAAPLRGVRMCEPESAPLPPALPGIFREARLASISGATQQLCGFLRPVLKHGPRSLTYVRVQRWQTSVRNESDSGGTLWHHPPASIPRENGLSVSIHVGTRKMVNYA